MRRIILPSVKPLETSGPGRGTDAPKILVSEVAFQRIDYGRTNDQGDILTGTVGMGWDIDEFSFGYFLVYDYMDYETFDGDRIGNIFFGQYNHTLTKNLTLGLTAHGHYSYLDIDNTHTFDYDDHVNYWGGGLSTSLRYDNGGMLVPSLAASYQYTRSDVSSRFDYQHLLKAGGSLGIRLGSKMVVNIYGMLNEDLSDISKDLEDDSFFEYDLELVYNLTDTFSFSGGYRKTLEYDSYHSDTLYIGSFLRF
ncbi:MAG: hypothetical protein GY868_09980 [Deltaproteobacteria bacterium]|nr:hypothetical protein [Deltaproteobacteria bacterium]